LIKHILKESTYCDWVVLILIFLFSIFIFFLSSKLYSNFDKVIIEVEGKKVYVLSLKEDKKVLVKGPLGITTVEIKKARVRIVDSPCTNKICVKQGWIKKGVIVCIPNKVVVKVGIKNQKEKGDIDAISG